MNILFLTIGSFNSIKDHEMYPDLLREFIKRDHKIYVVASRERRSNLPTELVSEGKAKLLKVRIGNITKTNIIEKGISTVIIASQYKDAVIKYFYNVKFDLILYPTPPITLCNVVEYVKKRDGASTYLLLKDIFPQNAVDMGMLRTMGIKAPLYQYFYYKEKRLYEISDTIGCMSPANVEYVLKHNPEIRKRDSYARSVGKHPVVEVSPNCIEGIDKSIDSTEREGVRRKYGIPLDRTVFVYGGNLGKPQGIDFMLKCLHSQRKNKEVFFIIVGNGTEYEKIEQYIEKYKPENITLHQWLPIEDYDKVVAACDVGMIFLDHRFTIPNFPSRLLSYMQCGLSVLACTDRNTDVGKVIVEGGFGWSCESNDLEAFHKCIQQACKSNLKMLGRNAFIYLKENYDVKDSVDKILTHMSR